MYARLRRELPEYSAAASAYGGPEIEGSAHSVPSERGYQLALDLDSPRPARDRGNDTVWDFSAREGGVEEVISMAADAEATAASIADAQPVTRVRWRAHPQPLETLNGLARNHRGKCSMLGELIEIVGEEAALKLVGAFGGTRLYVPQLPDANDALANLIGLSAAQRLARIYGGDRVDVPNPTARRVRILELRNTGLSADAIARELGCTRRRVFQVLAEARTPHRPK
jgi:hypothetical protein